MTSRKEKSPEGVLELTHSNGEVKQIKFSKIKIKNSVSIGIKGSGKRRNFETPISDLCLDIPKIGKFIIKFEEDEIESGIWSVSVDYAKIIWDFLLKNNWKIV